MLSIESQAPDLIDVREVARRLGIGRTSAWNLLQRGDIRSVRIGKSRRVAIADLAAYIDQLRSAAA